MQSPPGAILFGTDKAAGCPWLYGWLTLSTIMLDSLRDFVPRGMVFTQPDGLTEVERLSDAFV